MVEPRTPARQCQTIRPTSGEPASGSAELCLLERITKLEQQVAVLRELTLEPETFATLVGLVASIAKRVEALELGGSLLDRGAA
jgi:hypothetical protein